MNYADLPNLASPILGTRILFATDEWFAAAGKVFFRNDQYLRVLIQFCFRELDQG